MALALLVAHLADAAAWEQLRDPRVNEREWGRLLRSAGYVPTWILGAAALALASARAGHGPAGRWRAGVLLLAPAIAGGLAELLKIVVRRQRPGAESAAYLFRPYDVDFWSTRGLGMASSHTAVAFGAAAVLARCFPGTAPVWYLLAIGLCGHPRAGGRALPERYRGRRCAGLAGGGRVLALGGKKGATVRSRLF
jgi:membrane-associated phospholipid phosphatase